ncbi:MAG: tetratricopeptide repeat protein [Clostridia bacterium]|nr:tetratricopeptide repeat protein [Clostridia bacterium]
MRLEKEDYIDPACPLCGKPGEIETVMPVPVDRIQRKLWEYEDASDWQGAERHLLYWLSEADMNRDLRGALMLHNELMGFYRKQGKKDEALSHADVAVRLISELGMEDTVTAGTTWVNAGTVHEAFGDPVGGLDFFEKARGTYERNLPEGDGRLGGLYNNMALALTSCGRYGEAGELFRKALDVMGKQENGELEQAITWLNMADALEAELGAEDAAEYTGEYLDRAEVLLDTPGIPRNGYYAFVCEKCAPVFGHYGYFAEEAELGKRVKEIREGT